MAKPGDSSPGFCFPAPSALMRAGARQTTPSAAPATSTRRLACADDDDAGARGIIPAMSDAPIPPPAPNPIPEQPAKPAVQYAHPASPQDRKRQILGIVLGVVTAIILLIATPLVCSAIDAKMNPGELAGLGGLFLGAMIGAGLLVVTTIITFALPQRRRSPMLRGAGQGLLLVTALAGLTLGECALM
jgi:hypothetical protein